MSKLRDSISILKKNHVIIEKGLMLSELKEIETIYGVVFPKELKSFFSNILPVSQGFYNWRDFSDDNVAYIKAQMRVPAENILRQIDEVEWSDTWGFKPSDSEKTKEILRLKILDAPKMIPFLGHRYIPENDYDKCPVVSIHGIDVVYYGYGIEEFLAVEYGIKSQNSVHFEKIPNIDFWSDLI